MKIKIFVRVILCVVLAVMVCSLVTMKISILKKESENNETRALIDAQIMHNNEMSDILKDENRDDFYREIAEDDLDYVYPDEIVYIDITGH